MKSIKKFRDKYPKSDSKRKVKANRPKAKLTPESRSQKGNLKYFIED